MVVPDGSATPFLEPIPQQVAKGTEVPGNASEVMNLVSGGNQQGFLGGSLEVPQVKLFALEPGRFGSFEGVTALAHDGCHLRANRRTVAQRIIDAELNPWKMHT